MGEVYHARDSRLDQDVALKFLPEAAADPAQLKRFRAEVRIARQVSHPNVCRVYDLGEVNGVGFISMEYVDGEDLRSLLRRIGRLPADKAIEIARRLCAGMAAAHETGVLHRDLKPANIMIDGQGRVRIMDFGLAALASEIENWDVRSGTPSYMAPEQADGRGVSVRSDIYALGLVMFEMCTGQRPFDDSSDRSVPPSADRLVSDVDPAVAAVIQRCLDRNPARRPASALDVARALPGGDPLAEALAAGHTPSPEMVAASEDTGALSMRAAIACLVGAVAGLVAIVLLSPRNGPLSVFPAPVPPEVLTAQAREIAADLGYADPPADSSHGFVLYELMHLWAQEHLEGDEQRAMLSGVRPSQLRFWYRQSPRDLVTVGALSVASRYAPPAPAAGMVNVELDPEGRLLLFEAVPPQMEDPSSSAGTMNWQPLFDAAGLDLGEWTVSEPDRVPPVAFDERAAWTGRYEEAPAIEMRVEAAAWNGRPVFFALVGPWDTSASQASVEESLSSRRAAYWVVASVLIILIGGGCLIAWRNYVRGRGDLRGASRLAAVVFVGWLIQWFLLAHHVASID